MGNGKTLPWFWFYPADFFASQKVRVMTTAEVGAYFTLLCYAWMNEIPAHLPNDEEHLRELCRMTPDEWKVARRHIMACWKPTDDSKHIYNPRLLLVRQEAEEFSSRQKARAGKRWQCRIDAGSMPDHAKALGNAGSMPDVAISSSHSHPIPASNGVCSSSVVSAADAGTDTHTDGGEFPAAVCMELVTAWNALGPPFKHVQSLGPRVDALAALWRDGFFRDHWIEALSRVAASPWLRGDNPSRWVADIGWFLKPKSVYEIMEGKYAEKAKDANDW